MSMAARHAGLSRSTLYRHRAQDHAFAKAWDLALDEATDRLAGEAVRRAVTGVEEVRYFKGEPIGSVRKYSDQLLMFLLRAYRPSVFGRSTKGQDQIDAASPDDARQELIEKWRDCLVAMTPHKRQDFIANLSPELVNALLHDWSFWARDGQWPPEHRWRVWVIMAGRGYGKTRAGSEWCG